MNWITFGGATIFCRLFVHILMSLICPSLRQVLLLQAKHSCAHSCHSSTSPACSYRVPHTCSSSSHHSSRWSSGCVRCGGCCSTFPCAALSMSRCSLPPSPLMQLVLSPSPPLWCGNATHLCYTEVFLFHSLPVLAVLLHILDLYLLS